jgi:enediyne biosynthesis protein E4
LRNDGGNQRRWIEVRFQGGRSNRDGIGCRVSILAAGQRQMDELRSGGSYLSQNDLRLHFGLGQVQLVEEMEVRWPSGTVDRLRNVPGNQQILVVEGQGLQ